MGGSSGFSHPESGRNDQGRHPGLESILIPPSPQGKHGNLILR
jgi:hypothetical protein